LRGNFLAAEVDAVEGVIGLVVVLMVEVVVGFMGLAA
jgi:hypothetical protein